jgi:hypothetical protein
LITLFKFFAASVDSFFWFIFGSSQIWLLLTSTKINSSTRLRGLLACPITNVRTKSHVIERVVYDNLCDFVAMEKAKRMCNLAKAANLAGRMVELQDKMNNISTFIWAGILMPFMTASGRKSGWRKHWPKNMVPGTDIYLHYQQDSLAG